MGLDPWIDISVHAALKPQALSTDQLDRPHHKRERPKPTRQPASSQPALTQHTSHTHTHTSAKHVHHVWLPANTRVITILKHLCLHTLPASALTPLARPRLRRVPRWFHCLPKVAH